MAEKKKDRSVEDLKKQIDDLKNQNTELDNNWKRAVADLQNYKRRAEAERIEFVKYANQNILEEIVPVLDNFEMVLQHLDDAGVKVTVNQLRETLKKLGVKEIEVLNKEFDPNVAEAIEVRDTEEDKNNKVIEVLQKGYYYHDKVLRPARVVVGVTNTKQNGTL